MPRMKAGWSVVSSMTDHSASVAARKSAGLGRPVGNPRNGAASCAGYFEDPFPKEQQ